MITAKSGIVHFVRMIIRVMNTMNHDYAHCADYNEKCPKHCFRGALVRDLVNVPDYLPITFSNFKGTQYCEMEKQNA